VSETLAVPASSALWNGQADGTPHPLDDKIEVNGRNRHALYEALAGKNSVFQGRIWWNFTKFLVGRDGKILGRFGTRVKPGSTKLVQGVETALAIK
jgi:glutathione peroxidase